MNALRLPPDMLRSCALGHSEQLPRKLALTLWAQSGHKAVFTDLQELLATPALSSSIRTLALDLLTSTFQEKSWPVIQAQLAQETHPRLIRRLLELTGIGGPAEAFDLLTRMPGRQAWPGSSRQAWKTALRLLRHRWHLPIARPLDEWSVPCQAPAWSAAPLPVKPASGPVFQRALDVATRQIPGCTFSRDYAAVFSCGPHKMVLLIHPDLNQSPSSSPLFQHPDVAGLVMRQTEDSFTPFAWVLSAPDSSKSISLDVFHVDGQKLYMGSGERIDEAIHFMISTVEGAPVPAMTLSIGFRPNQILSGGYLKRPKLADPGIRPSSHELSKTA